MIINKITVTDLFKILYRSVKLILYRGPFVLGVKILYHLTHENGDIDGILTKRKYRRIKQSIRYKIWLWKYMKGLCVFYRQNYEKYLKYNQNKKILRY